MKNKLLSLSILFLTHSFFYAADAKDPNQESLERQDELFSTYHTPLIQHIWDRPDDLEGVQKIIDSNANVNHRTISGETALGAAALQGSHELVELLLKNNASVDGSYTRRTQESDRYNCEVLVTRIETPLSLAMKQYWIHNYETQADGKIDFAKVIAILKTQGADRSKRCVLQASAREKYNKEKHEYKDDLDPNADIEECFFWTTPLLKAIDPNPFATRKVLRLLARNADPNKSSRGGRTPLALAASTPNIDIVYALIAANAEVDQADTSYYDVKTGSYVLETPLAKAYATKKLKGNEKHCAEFDEIIYALKTRGADESHPSVQAAIKHFQ